MYWLSTQPLIEALQRDAVTDREKMQYFLACSAYLALGATQSGNSSWFALFGYALASAAGVLLWYWANGGARGQRLIERAVCIGWPITVRVICLYLPIVVGLEFAEVDVGTKERMMTALGYAADIVSVLWIAIALRAIARPARVPASSAAQTALDAAQASPADMAQRLTPMPPTPSREAIPDASGGGNGGLWWIFPHGEKRIAVCHAAFRSWARVYVNGVCVARESSLAHQQTIAFEHEGTPYEVTIQHEARAPGVQRMSATLATNGRTLQKITLRYALRKNYAVVAVIVLTGVVLGVVLQLPIVWVLPIMLGLLLASFLWLFSVDCEVETPMADPTA